jgi:hypothetical protein
MWTRRVRQSLAMLLRPLRVADVTTVAAAVTADPAAREAATGRAAFGWERRARHLLSTDAPGAWLAERDGRVLGSALALRRDGWWILSSLDVQWGPDREVGRLLLERAVNHGAAALRGFINAGPDSPALGLYRVLGHRLHPTLRLAGTVQRTALPVVRTVRDGAPADVDLADAVDRLVRGAAHGPDHGFLARDHALLVAESPSGRGYAWVCAEGLAVLAATDVPTARELLCEVFARTPADGTVVIERVTAEQDWAVDLAVRAGVSIGPDGFVCLRGMPRLPVPYIPSTWFG